MEEEKSMQYGCLYCRTGVESIVADMLQKRYPQLHVIVPQKIRIRRMGGVYSEEKVILFPGYVFFETQFEFNYSKNNGAKYEYKLMKNADAWQLEGSDREIVQALFAADGVIVPSKVYQEGERITVLEGFLKDCKGEIMRVNKRFRTAQVKIHLMDKDILVWLNYEMMDEVSRKEI